MKIFAVITFTVAGVLAAQQPKRETLLQTTKSWTGAAYQYPAGQAELSVVRITIPAHGKLEWHEHRVPNAAYVLSGTLTVEARDGRTQHYAAGQVLPEVVNLVHRGEAGAEDVVLIVFYAGAEGVPLAVPVK